MPNIINSDFMIIYFSATGNNKYLAQKIAENTGEDIISIVKCVKENIFDLNVPENESLGIIVPTYFWGLPSIVEEFLSGARITLNPDTYVYSIASYGTSTGYALGYIRNYLKKQDIEINAEFEVKMTDTWTVMFDLTDKDKINKEQEEVEAQLKNIIPKILNKESNAGTANLFSKIGGKFAGIMYDNQRKCKNLHVLDTCISCSLCSKDCPVNAIEMADGKPVWTKDRCVMCFRCLHRCPTFSIQYNDKTINHGQYTNPHIDVFD